MFVALLISGVGAAAVPVAGMTAILIHFPPDRRGRILGLRQMAVPVGGFVAAGLLPILYHLGGLELAFARAGRRWCSRSASCSPTRPARASARPTCRRCARRFRCRCAG